MPNVSAPEYDVVKALEPWAKAHYGTCLGSELRRAIEDITDLRAEVARLRVSKVDGPAVVLSVFAGRELKPEEKDFVQRSLDEIRERLIAGA